MGHSKAEKDLSHGRILDVAADLFRERGLDGVSLADLMADAGMTHGGFYRHFPSRDAVVAEATERAFRKSGERVTEWLRTTDGGLEALLDAYFADEHVADPAKGCPVAALAADAARSPAARPAFTRNFEAYSRWIAARLGGPTHDRDARAAAIAAAMAGAVAVARALEDPAARRVVLEAAKDMILAAETSRAA